MRKPDLHNELCAVYRELIGFFRRRLCDGDDASDLAHDTIMRVLATDTPVETPRAFVFQAARNLLIDRHRTRRQYVTLAEAGVEAMTSPEAAPDLAVQHRQIAYTLSAAIESLPPRSREAFVLHKLHGMTHSEVAKQLGISVNMVEKHVMRGLLACRHALHEKEGAP